MTITIQLDDKRTITATPGSDSSVAGAYAMASANDGGAPKVGGVTDSNASPIGNMMDIGGPPQWLSDAIGSKGSTSSGATASADSNGGSEGQDGGAGPAF